MAWEGIFLESWTVDTTRLDEHHTPLDSFPYSVDTSRSRHSHSFDLSFELTTQVSPSRFPLQQLRLDRSWTRPPLLKPPIPTTQTSPKAYDSHRARIPWRTLLVYDFFVSKFIPPPAHRFSCNVLKGLSWEVDLKRTWKGTVVSKTRRRHSFCLGSES